MVQEVKSSEKVEVKAAAGSLFDNFGSGEDITPTQIIDKQNTSDENLALKTEINDPLVMAVWDAVADFAEDCCYPRTAARMKAISRNFKENMVSFKRKGRIETKEMVIADLQKAQEQNEGELDRLMGKRGR